MEQKKIRFIDSQYKDLFTVQDDANIIVSTKDGEKLTLPCRYIDEYHTKIGSNVYHICEFAEHMERNGSTYAPEQIQQNKSKTYER